MRQEGLGTLLTLKCLSLKHCFRVLFVSLKSTLPYGFAGRLYLRDNDNYPCSFAALKTAINSNKALYYITATNVLRGLRKKETVHTRIHNYCKY